MKSLWNGTALAQVWEWYTIRLVAEDVLIELPLDNGKRLLRISIFVHYDGMSGEIIGHSYSRTESPRRITEWHEDG